MGQLISVPVGFALIILLLIRKVSIGNTMFFASAVMGLLGGFGVQGTLEVFVQSLTARNTLELMAVITTVCILGHLLHHYKVLDKMVDALEDLIKSARVLIMLIPSIMGTLFIPGGAILSAPIVDNLGDRIEIGKVRKSAINMVFRHSWFFIFPFSTSIILASRIGEVYIYDLIKVNIPITVAMIISGYCIYVRSCPETGKADYREEDASLPVKLGRAILYTSPLWVGVVLNILFGFPFYLALIPGIIITYLLTDGEKGDFLKTALRGIKFTMLYSVAGIMVLQGFIRKMSSIKQVIEILSGSGITIELIMIAAAMFVGFSTASNPAVVGMLYPVFLPLAPDYHARTMYAFLIFVSGYLAYFVSPMHLCQVFTAEYFNIKVSELYKEYRVLWPVIFCCMLVVYLVIR